MKLFLIIQKNLKLLIKHKKSSLLLLFIPLLLVFFGGLAFDHFNQYRITISTYTPDNTELTKSFIAKLNTDSFTTLQSDSSADCIDNVKRGITETCIVFPRNLTKNTQNSSQLTIYVDYSQLNLAFVVKDLIGSKVEEQSLELSQNITKDILSQFAAVKQDITKRQQTVATLQKDIQTMTIRASELTSSLQQHKNAINTTDASLQQLAGKINSLQSSLEELNKHAEKGFDLAESILEQGTFENEAQLQQKITNALSNLRDEQHYMDTLLSVGYEHSVPELLYESEAATNLSKKEIVSITNTSSQLSKIIEQDKKTMQQLGEAFDKLQLQLNQLTIIKAEAITEPLKTDIQPVTPSTYLNYIFPTLMVTLLMFAGLLLAAVIIIMEKNSPANFRNVLSPTSAYTFFSAHYLTTLIILSLQIIVMVLTSLIFITTLVLAVPVILLCLIIATVFILIGMLIGSLFSSEQTATLAATSTGIVMLFFSNTILPMESMPKIIATIVRFNPFVLAETSLRKIILFHEFSTSIFFMVIAIVILLLGNIIIIKTTKFQ